MAKRSPNRSRYTQWLNRQGFIDVYRQSFSLKDLQEMHRTLAKRANQRIVRLEAAGVDYGQYKLTQRYLQMQGRTRFSESPTYSDNINILRREITEIQGFLTAKTSTISGIREIERKRQKTFEGKGIHFENPKEFYDFLNSKDFEDLKKAGIASEQIVEEFTRLGNSANDYEYAAEAIADALKAYREGAQKLNEKSFSQYMKQLQP